jgi:hypothetical protein
MIKFALGFFTCMIIMTVGFSGIAKIGDNFMDKTQTIVKEAAK